MYDFLGKQLVICQVSSAAGIVGTNCICCQGDRVRTCRIHLLSIGDNSAELSPLLPSLREVNYGDNRVTPTKTKHTNSSPGPITREFSKLPLST